MTTTVKRTPHKACPKCGQSIHARCQKHDECGWKAEATRPTNGQTASAHGNNRLKLNLDARPPKVRVTHQGLLCVTDIETLQDMLQRVTPDELHRLVDMLA